MASKILLVVALIILTWWWTRPRSKAKLNKNESPEATEALVQCEHCGVYHPAADKCNCQGKKQG